jgi:ATP-dependent Clp protease adaptor protein ClpS
MTTATDAKIIPRIKPKENIPEPVRYNVIYINDEVTTMEFVVETLTIIFDYDRTSAEEMAERIHKEGSAVVSTMPFELAEQKGVEVTMLARNNGFPLVVKLEPEV